MKTQKLKFISAILIFISIFISFNFCFSQWEKVGTFDYSKDIPIKFHFKCCDKIFLSGEGIFISTDEGNNWIDPGYEIYNSTSITGFGSNIFIGCVDIRIEDPRVLFRSTNCGNDWREVSSKNFRFPNVYSLCSKGTDVIAGTSNGCLLYTSDAADE